MKQFYPIVAFAVMAAGGWFFFTNWQVDVTSNAPQLIPRAAGSGPLFSPSTTVNNPFNTTAPVAPLPTPANVPLAPSTVTGNIPATTNGGSIGNWLNAAGQMLARGNAPASNAPANNYQPANVAPAQGLGVPGGRDTIRIASFNIQVFGEQKMAQPDVVNVLANVIRNFDIVAIQEVRSKTQDILPNFVAAINATGRRYDYVIGERLGRTSSKEQYAYVFDTDTVEVDRRSLYTVADPDDLLHREPLVGWFRCRAVDPRQAFTFTLVNIHIDPDEVSVTNATSEINVLDDVFRAVRDDGRGEDDVILLGDLNANDQHLGQIARVPNIAWVISNTPTNTRGNAQYDNLIYDRLATREFTGKGGVFDYMRQYNLSLDQALRVSDHLVVWAEFSVYEGGVNGRVAARPTNNAPATYQDPRAYQQDSAYQNQNYQDPRTANYPQRTNARAAYVDPRAYQQARQPVYDDPRNYNSRSYNSRSYDTTNPADYSER